jgi:hypothetical protein
LKRLNLAKEIKGFPLISFGWAWLDFAQIWPDLGEFGIGFGKPNRRASAAAAVSVRRRGRGLTQKPAALGGY